MHDDRRHVVEARGELHFAKALLQAVGHRLRGGIQRLPGDNVSALEQTAFADRAVHREVSEPDEGETASRSSVGAPTESL